MFKKHEPETANPLVRGRTLSAALRRVRDEYGEGAMILDSREAADGSGRVFEIEVAVEPTAVAAESGSTAAIAREVERIEALVDSLEAGVRAGRADEPLDDFARILVHRGVSRSAARHITRLREAEAETGLEPILHLASLLRTAQGGWGVMSGRHLFVGRRGAGRSDLVHGVAAALADLGSRVLVLDMAPRHEGEVRRLRSRSLETGYDAAVLRDPRRLTDAGEQFAPYDAVLIDAPDLDHPVVRDDVLVEKLTGDEDVQRHLVMPMDGDPAARETLWRLAKSWHCDWLALSRLDLMERPGALIDHLLAAPYPVSLLARGPQPETRPEIATSRRILELVLRGVESETAPPAARSTEE